MTTPVGQKVHSDQSHVNNPLTGGADQPKASFVKGMVAFLNQQKDAAAPKPFPPVPVQQRKVEVQTGHSHWQVPAEHIIQVDLTARQSQAPVSQKPESVDLTVAEQASSSSNSTVVSQSDSEDDMGIEDIEGDFVEIETNESDDSDLDLEAFYAIPEKFTLPLKNLRHLTSNDRWVLSKIINGSVEWPEDLTALEAYKGVYLTHKNEEGAVATEFNAENVLEVLNEVAAYRNDVVARRFFADINRFIDLMADVRLTMAALPNQACAVETEYAAKVKEKLKDYQSYHDFATKETHAYIATLKATGSTILLDDTSSDQVDFLLFVLAGSLQYMSQIDRKRIQSIFEKKAPLAPNETIKKTPAKPGPKHETFVNDLARTLIRLHQNTAPQDSIEDFLKQPYFTNIATTLFAGDVSSATAKLASIVNYYIDAQNA